MIHKNMQKLAKSKHTVMENYVLDRIHHRLNDYSIRFDTQHSVKAASKNYRIDMYFPDFNIGIEVDEGHHKTQLQEDEYRHDLIEANKQCVIHRIDMTKPSLVIYRDIDEVVTLINEAAYNFEVARNTSTAKMSIKEKVVGLFSKIKLRSPVVESATPQLVQKRYCKWCERDRDIIQFKECPGDPKKYHFAVSDGRRTCCKECVKLKATLQNKNLKHLEVDKADEKW